jgi:hypothetical protein
MLAIREKPVMAMAEEMPQSTNSLIITLSKISHAQKDKYRMFSLICGKKKKTKQNMTVERKLIGRRKGFRDVGISEDNRVIFDNMIKAPYMHV